MKIFIVPSRIKSYVLSACVAWSGITMYAQPKIIIKLDDLEAKPSSFDACMPIFEFLSNNGIKAGWGVMRIENINDLQITTLKKYLEKTNSKGELLFEIWHHGFDHSKDNPLGTWEFSGTSYAYQKTHFDSASRVLKNMLGVTAHTFGAPFNHIDTTLLQVMSEDSNMKVILLGQQTLSAATDIINLNHRVNMESATGVVNFEYFFSNYNSKKTVYKDFMVLQGHPARWTTDALKEEFKKIITFLVSEGCEFVTPYGYYCYINKLDRSIHK
jgi:hypothetical protein